MKESIKSFFLLICISIILGTIVVLTLDVLGIITLPEKISIRSLLKENTEEVALVDSNVISYPKEYYIEENVRNDNKTENNANLTTIPTNIANKPSLENTIVYGANNYFYYNQLNTYGKTIYTQLYKNIDNLKTGTYTVDYGDVFNDLLNTEGGEQTLTDAFQLSINALLLDHPEIFYLDVTKMFMYTEINKTLLETTYKISIGPEDGTNYLIEGFNTKSDVIIAEDQINTILYGITSNFGDSVYDKVKDAHDYVVDSLVYDENDEMKYSHNVYGALIEKIAVCDGYAKIYKLLLDYMGIHCVQVCGTAQNSSGVVESHTWNYVFINDEWYAIDTTWDDPIIIGGGVLTDSLKYRNFLCGSETFFKNHKEDGYIVSNGCFAYPTLNKNNY